MPHWKITFFCLLLSLGACTNKKTKVLSTTEQRARLDTALRIQQAEIIQMEQERLRDRLSIEVKEKTDSILAVRKKTTIPQMPTSDDTTAQKTDITTQNTPL